MTRGGGAVAQASADDKTLYFVRETDRARIYRVPTGGTEAELFFDPGTGLHGWILVKGDMYLIRRGPGGRLLSGGGEILVVNLATKAARTILRTADTPSFGLSLSPDGKSLLYSLRDYEGVDLMLAEGFR